MFSFKSSKDNDSETKFRVVPTVVHGHTFTLSTRYSLADSKVLGRGSFGVVVTAHDSVTGRTVAIKRIRPYANDDWDGRHTLREIRLLRLLGNHPNIITLYDLSLYEEKTELYMMLELMDCDLHRVIQSKQALTMKHNKCFIRQIIEGIKAMHEIGVFHRDLKPGNILVSKDCQVRITDFGLARYMHESTRQGNNALNPMTEYVVTRWYRCPELLLAPNRPYDEAIDMWSIGCILAELLRRKPLFPGKSHPNQVQLIFEVFGYSDRSELGFEISAEAALFMDKKCRYRKQSLRSVIPEADDQAMELLEALLAINPSKRPTAQESLQFAFNTDADVLYDYSKSYLKPPSQNYFDFEHETYDISQLRQLIHDEVDLYKRHIDGVDKTAQAAANNSNKKSPRPGSGDSNNGDKNGNQNKIEPQVTSRQDDGPSSQMATMPRGGHNANSNNNNNNNNINNNNANNNSSNISRNVSNTSIPTNNNASRPPVPNASNASNSSKTNPFASSSTSQKSQQSSNVSQTVGGVLAYARNLNASSPAPRTPKTPTQQQMQTIINKDTKLKHRMLIQKTDNGVPQPRQLQPLPSNYVSMAHSSSTTQLDNNAATDNKNRIPPIANNTASKNSNSSRQGISSILSHLHSKYQSLSARDEMNQAAAAVKQQGARKVATAPDHASRADSNGHEKQASKKSSFIPFPSLRR